MHILPFLHAMHSTSQSSMSCKVKEHWHCCHDQAALENSVPQLLHTLQAT